MAARAKHHEIFQRLHWAIAHGEYAPGVRLPSEVALSRRFGVSRPTVAQALRELQRLDLIERRAGAGSFVRRVTRAGTFGLLTDGLDATEIVEPLSAELMRVVRLGGWNLSIGPALHDRDPETVAQEWAASGVAGVFFAPLENHPVRAAVNRAVTERLKARGLAVVLLDRDIVEFPQRSDHDLVGIDDFFGGYEIAAHLLDRGACRLVMLARPAFPATTDLRLAGVRAATLRTEGASVEFCVGDPDDTAWVKQVRTQTQCDAIVCSNDSTAARLMHSLDRLRCQVPETMLVAGFDDARSATRVSPALTTMRQPYPALAGAAVEAMLARLKQPVAPGRRILLRAELIVRASTGG